MGAFELLVLALATWRLSHLLAREDGPWDLFRGIRLRVGAFETVNGGWQGKGVLSRLIVCPLCLSVWIALALYAAFVAWPWAWGAVVVLGLSGAACIVQLALDRSVCKEVAAWRARLCWAPTETR